MMNVPKRKRHSRMLIPGDLGLFNDHVDYYKRMKKLLDAKQTQVDLITHRRKAIQDSNILNYQNEYNRILGVLENQNPGLQGHSRAQLDQRKLELERLGAKAVGGIEP